MIGIHLFEQERLKLQSELDAKKTQAERNRLGQFATPTALALDILTYASTLIQEGEKVRFLDPAVGTGSFFSAFQQVFPKEKIDEALGFEVDPHYGNPASHFWRNSDFTIRLADFTTEEPSGLFNLVICNPPYVRHHHLQNSDKLRLQAHTAHSSGMTVSGLAGLYCHFLGLSHAWMADGAIAGWLIPSEFMDVNYGREVKRYLLEKVTLLKIHRFDPDDVQFADALVSSAVVWFKKEPPPTNHRVAFTFGGTLFEPRTIREISTDALVHEAKWTRYPHSDIRQESSNAFISDFFDIRRGIATGDNHFFILDGNEIRARELPIVAFQPILPSPRYLTADEVNSDANGWPLLDRQLFLLDTKLTEERLRETYPTLHAYLEEGRARGIHEGYLCSHRSPWYSQENRPTAPIVCTYLGRRNTRSGRPFRFILNNSSATVANVYLAMYPKPKLAKALKEDKSLLRKIWIILNQITPEQLLGESRVYGGGLHKLEPGELANVEVPEIAELIPDFNPFKAGGQLALF
jgi:predicted RNA methylase